MTRADAQDTDLRVSLFHEIAGPLYPVLDWPMNTGPDGGYNFCSGVAGIGIVGTLWHRHNCHEARCPWPVRHGKVYCRKHERVHREQEKSCKSA